MKRCFVLALLAASACGGRTVADGETDESGETGGDPWADHHDLYTMEHFNVDMLFVIDDSVSMATAQRKIAELAPLFESLDHLDCDDGKPDGTSYDYRIAFTTTDNGNPLCTSSAEAGDLVLQPCFERLDDFVLGDVDVRDEACLDRCSLDADALEIAATPVDGDPVPRVRPWIERIDGISNLPLGTDIRDAVACSMPQGIAGCAFESPLESMLRALEGAATPGHPNFGFLRDDADLLVVILSDSYDCSLAPGGEAIFDPDGEKAFWSNPDAESPTPAVCFNAGMQCIENPDGWDTCEPANKGVSGEPVEGDAAVLHPVERYLDFLAALQQDKQTHGANLTVVVAAGFTDHGDVHYELTTDPAHAEQYGVGPGCNAPSFGDEPLVEIPPAARMFEIVEAFGKGESMCGYDIGMVLTPFEHTCPGWLPPFYPNCVLDSDPGTPQLDPECEVAMHVPDEESTLMVECLRGSDGEYLIDSESQDHAVPQGADLCFVLVADEDNPFAHDTLNLQIRIVRRPGVWVKSGTRFTASCTETDCPPF